jgi:quercetin dioxygenase-like cupin family protein
MTPTSSDSRRDLYEFEYPVSKLVIAKERCVLGRHFHKLKTELFILLSGTGRMRLGNADWTPLPPLSRIDVPPGLAHTFELAPGSILLGYCSKSYDPTDDYELEG